MRNILRIYICYLMMWMKILDENKYDKKRLIECIYYYMNKDQNCLWQ